MEGREGKLWSARDVSGTEISFKSYPAEINFPSPWLTTVLASRGLAKKNETGNKMPRLAC